MKKRPFPQIFYGWVIVGVSAIILLIVWGCNYSFGIFFKPLIAEFGWSRTTTSLAYSIFLVVHSLSQPIVGRISDRWGPRIPIIIAGVCMGTGYLLMSQLTQLWQIYVYYGGIIAIGVTFAYIPLTSTV